MRISLPYVCPICGSRLPRAAARCFSCEHPLPVYKGPATARSRKPRPAPTAWKSGDLPPVYLPTRDFGPLKNIAGMMLPDDTAASLLRSEIDRAIVCDEGFLPDGVVRLGSEVQLHDHVGGVVREIGGVLVFPQDDGPGLPGIPVTSPLGAAVLGLRAGDRMPYVTADGHHHVASIQSVGSPAGLGRGYERDVADHNGVPA